MPKIVGSIEINASKDRVWEVISDLDNEADYWWGTKEVRNISKDGNVLNREIIQNFRSHKILQKVILTPKSEIETRYEESGRERVSFDAIIRKYNLEDPALLELAKIVRGADASIEDTPPESAGLEAAAIGFQNIAKDDHDNMRLQFPLYDAIYRYCQLKIDKFQKLEHATR